MRRHLLAVLSIFGLAGSVTPASAMGTKTLHGQLLASIQADDNGRAAKAAQEHKAHVNFKKKMGSSGKRKNQGTNHDKGNKAHKNVDKSSAK